MNINELKRYEYWVGKTPQSVLVAVLAAGGWKNVFPTTVPRWASRVRNYFNVTPKSLEPLPTDQARRLIEQAQRRLGFLKDCHAVQTFNRTNCGGMFDLMHRKERAKTKKRRLINQMIWQKIGLGSRL